jgi:hypothetical protein
MGGRLYRLTAPWRQIASPALYLVTFTHDPARKGRQPFGIMLDVRSMPTEL